jgi:L-lactate dehydrogenase complex protein LldG
MAPRTFRQRFADGKSAARLATAGVQQTKAPDVPADGREAPADRFSRELEALGGHIVRVNQAELNPRLLDFLREQDVQTVPAWAAVAGIDRTWLHEHGVTLTGKPDPSLKVGLTGADAAIAETGTILVTSGAGRPLTASLLPDIHIAVLHASQIAWSLEEVLHDGRVADVSAAALITGPSRTGDIEMTLTIGVHGPKELWVYLVE